jgi:hypothetical protein
MTQIEIPTSITCPDCGATSHDESDVLFGYCSGCHEFTGTMPIDDKPSGLNLRDRKGRPIGIFKFTRLMIDREYSQLKRTYLPGAEISTAWVGTKWPNIYETLTTEINGAERVGRWPTPEAAIEYHDQEVARIKTKG